MNDCTTKNGQVNAVTMKDVVDACCNAKRESIDVNMEAATTVGNIKELTHANGKDETDLLIRVHVPDRLVRTGKSDIGINAMDDTAFAATAIDGVQMKGMISFIFFVEQFQVPMEFLISNRLFIFHLLIFVNHSLYCTCTACTAKNVHGNVTCITGGDTCIDPTCTIDRCSIVCQGLCQEGQNQGTI